MQSTLQDIVTVLQGNQILSTVAGGSVIVWVVSNLKAIWKNIVMGFTALISFRIVNTYEDNRMNGSVVTTSQKMFDALVANSKVLWERTNHLDLSNHAYYGPKEPTEVGKRPSNIENLAYGFSIRLMFGKIVCCTREIEKQQKITVTTTLRVFFASKKRFMAKLIAKIEDDMEAEQIKKSSRDYVIVWNGEFQRSEKNKRSMESIFTNNNEHYHLLDAIKTFLDNKEKYKKLAYPYNFSALLYGDPGCGKSSCILAIASALNRNISYVNLSKTTIEKILASINSADGDIIVFEDIDALSTAVGASREKRDTNKEDGEVQAPIMDANGIFTSVSGTSLSDILNFTDGLLASDGAICLFTTNHIERLDPALLRAGRMNELVKFTNLTPETSSRMIKANLGIDIPPSNLKDNINPAELQSTILKITLGNADKIELDKFLTKKEDTE